MSETVEERLERGYRVVAGLMGQEFADALRATATPSGFGSTIARTAVEFCFAEGWDGGGLDKRDRSLVMLGTLIALRQTSELKNHVRIALTNGLTVQEIEQVLMQAMPYVGVPAIASALTATIEALRESGRDPAVRTSEEKGLL